MIIEPSHFEYLQIQRGEVSDKRGDFRQWKLAYEASLDKIFESIGPVLPKQCEAVLDIGSGLGGIDILLARHYGPHLAVGLVDGVDNQPVVRSHASPFSNATVAIDFQGKNGSKHAFALAPEDDWPDTYGLIVSFAAYAFHIPPTTYLDRVVKASRKGTVIIFDVRRTKRHWLEQLIEALGEPKVLVKGEKFVRCAWTRN